jgi:hypothetical protein
MPPVSDTCVIENHVGARDAGHQCLVGSALVIAWLYCTLLWCDGTALFLPWGLPVGHGVLELTPPGAAEFVICDHTIEFLFRDAKQLTGLTDCQARSQAKLDFHCNATVSAVNLAKLEARQERGYAAPSFSAQFLAVCSSSILAETRVYAASLSSPWRGKRRVFERRKPLLTDQLQPSTNADKLSEEG